MNFVQCIHDFSLQNGLGFSLFLGGLAGGFTHCAGMCAPFVLAQTKVPDASNAKISLKTPVKISVLKKISGAALLPYHLGRMTTYVALAAIFHSVLNLALLFSEAKAILSAFILTLAAVLFLISVFPAFGKIFPWAARIRISVPGDFFGKVSYALMQNPGPFKRYALGILLGFMPCGLVLAAIMAAATAPNVWVATGFMTAFAVGTMPALILVALGAQAVQAKFPKAMQMVRQGAVVISAMWLFVLAGLMMI